jgi:hypothetical protein
MGLMRNSLFLFSFVLLLVGCNRNPYNIDTDSISINLDFTHSDSILRSISQKGSLNSPRQWLQHRDQIYQSDKDIAGYLFGYCYGVRMKPDTSFLNGLNRYNTNPFVLRLEERISQQFSTKLPGYSNTVKESFKRLKAHFPKQAIPSHIFWINSGFTSSIFCSKKSIAIGLERYLGPKADVIKELPNDRFYSWIKDGMLAKYINRDVVLGWLSTHYIDETKENYASEMIRWGKLLFITYAVLPNESEATIMRYGQKDYDWALASEGALWKYIVDEQLLYETGEDAKQSLLHEGPFTRGLPQESPDRMGQFLGYRMVKQYMENNDISLSKLKTTPYLKILQAYEAPQKK